MSADVLVDIVWGASPPSSAASTLQSYVSRLRKVLEAAGEVRLESEQSAYRLIAPRESIDVDEFDRRTADARECLDDGDPRAASDHLRAALALGRGSPMVELGDHAPAVAEAVRLGAWWSRAELEEHVRDEHSTFCWLLEAMLERSGFATENASYSNDGILARYVARAV